jgi:hypothetical protein
MVIPCVPPVLLQLAIIKLDPAVCSTQLKYVEPQTAETGGSSGLSSGAIAGIVIGVIIGLVVIGGVVYYFFFAQV